MQLGQLPVVNRLVSWSRVRFGAAIPALAGGTLVGLLLISIALPWLLTWGWQREFMAAACVMFSTGLLVSRALRLGENAPVTYWAGAACIWSMLQPACLFGLTSCLSVLPVTSVESLVVRPLIALACAAPVWLVAAVCLARVVDLSCRRSVANGGSFESASVAACCGIACGLGANALLLVPLLGVWLVALVAFSITAVCLWRGASLRTGAENTVVADPGSVGSDAGSIRHGRALIDAPTLSRRVLENPFFDVGSPSSWLLSVFVAAALGGLFAVVTRLIEQLMPGGFQVLTAEWIGLVVGCGCGMLLSHRLHNSSRWTWLAAAAWSALLWGAFPVLVELELWMNASLTWVAALLLARSMLFVLAVAPLGMAFGELVAGYRSSPRQEDSGHERLSMAIARFCLPFVLGLLLAGGAIETVGLLGSMRLCCGMLVLLAVVEQIRLRDRLAAWPVRLGFAGLVLAGLALPAWRSQDDAARVSKLLFSTPAFMAHRSGWESRLLPQLDDTRMVARMEGPHGPLTLWRSRGLELHLRENGVPRSVISVNTNVHPQFAPEVLQAALPLVMADNPNRVLLLGASGGVPLSTCLHFPVREAVCVEGDARLIEMLRGPLAHETGVDPLSDDRVKLLAAPPELALMTNDAVFDVILSSPPPSSIISGAASFTVEYYQRASRRLADRGIFCQRFECLDYGPSPLRLVVLALRQAFREVIAVETAAGDLLLMATNSKGVFVPDDLPARLETPHVRRLLARSGLDWSTPLNFPTYDHAALGEICDEARTGSNSSTNGLLATTAPLDMMRWGPKLQESQRVLTAIRTSPTPNWNRDDEAKPNLLAQEVKTSRKSRFLDWLGDSRVSAELLRRLSEVATQQKLVREYPEEHWWQYRKALRQQLQDHPRSPLQQVRHVRGEKQTHPEDLARKAYFEAFGDAAQRAKPTDVQIAAMEACLEPFDPLMSYFARQEIADLQARSDVDAVGELTHRLHVVYFAPVGEASTRNVASTIELLVRHPESIPDDARRFDVLNGLVQLLRTRWESRQNTPVLSARKQLTDVDRSVIAVEKALTSMGELSSSVALTEEEWATRKQVVDRILLRPLRAYRSSLQTAAVKNEGRSRAIIEQADEPTVE